MAYAAYFLINPHIQNIVVIFIVVFELSVNVIMIYFHLQL